MLEKIEVILESGASVPVKAHDQDAGYDIFAPWMMVIPAHRRSSIDTGVHFNIPNGYYGRIESKSGLMRGGITARGIIDSGFTGTVKVVLFNHTDSAMTIEAGQKIAQIIFLKHESPVLEVVDKFSEEFGDRKTGEFGSTGK